MNERTALPAVAPPPPPPPQARRAVSGRDREFLPAALEILESPPPPAPIALIATICTFALAALIWSFFGRLDVHAVAQGKIETAGYSKVIEPLDPGKIAAIHVEARQTVKAGDLIFELDPAEANADATAAEDALNASCAEIARRRFAIEAVRSAEAQEAHADGGQDNGAAEKATSEAPTPSPMTIRRRRFPSLMSVNWPSRISTLFPVGGVPRCRQVAVMPFCVRLDATCTQIF